jgi:hypothetical protein
MGALRHRRSPFTARPLRLTPSRYHEGQPLRGLAGDGCIIKVALASLPSIIPLSQTLKRLLATRGLPACSLLRGASRPLFAWATGRKRSGSGLVCPMHTFAILQASICEGAHVLIGADELRRSPWVV